MDRFGRPVAASPQDVLVILAHQDDEAGIVTRIRHEIVSGNRVWCAYLTDGATSAPAAVRDSESLAVLSGLGVSSERVTFVRDESGRIADGTLMLQLDRARRSLSGWATAAGTQFTRIYTVDWEGGHADHDACHLITIIFAHDLGISDVWTFSLYNAYRRPRGLFRVLSFVPASETIVRRKLNAREVLGAAAVVFAYPSQRRTWLALGPCWIAKTILRREELLRRPSVTRLRNRPHDGPLLYETLFKLDSDKMLAASAELRHQLLEPT